MKITLLLSDPNHPVSAHLKPWVNAQKGVHNVELLHSKSQLSGGELLFLVSCSEIIKDTDRIKFEVTLVLHASDLPKGRGWSPHIWEIVNGAEHITLSLLEAEDKVDSGRIWAKRQIDVPKDALWDEINHLLFTAEVELIDLAVKEFGQLTPVLQPNVEEATYYPKRTPQDSQLDPNKTIAEQFNRIRVCDPNRYPAFFEIHGKKYKLTLEKLDD
jgi:methionyl-tRNA formyltransferase